MTGMMTIAPRTMSLILLDLGRSPSNANAMFDPWAPENSVLREKVVEHLFLSDLSRYLLLERATPFEVLRAEFDAFGYDLVIDVDGVQRHVQLKAGRLGGRRTEVDINVSLATKPSGCVIWIMVDPNTFALGPFYWFGGPPQHPLPELGDRIARHSKANALGTKTARPKMRSVRKTAFRRLDTMAAVVASLFGPGDDQELRFLRKHIAEVGADLCGNPELAWLREVAAGDFSSIPVGMGWEGSCELAHLVDGYALVGARGPAEAETFMQRMWTQRDETGQWLGSATELWAMLFLEHRRYRFAGTEPTGIVAQALDQLVERLADVLRRESGTLVAAA